MQLKDIKINTYIRGIVPGEVIEVISVRPFDDHVIELFYKNEDGSLGVQLLYDHNLEGISIEDNRLTFSFDSNANEFRLVSEAYRIKLAHLFDPYLAVHTSIIRPLPHQITAVYGDMLNKKPLRFLLADDPGSGKTIMTGLLIKELIVRGDLNRCLIVSPGNLVDQWQDELASKFQLEFKILTNESIGSSIRGNVFNDIPFCIARLDKLSRNEELKERLKATDWDLIVCDEAHKMAATIFGDDEKRTKRYNLGMLLSSITRHFLLLSATPHNGKDKDFQLFMKLLDNDRFEGVSRIKGKIDTSDIMRRLVKEQLLTFEGKPLFPERIAYTLGYELSSLEKQLYDEVTEYVRNGFNKAMEIIDKGHAHAVGFALTVLQRRLASSPEAIYQSLKRRRERLGKRLNELNAKDISTLTQRSFSDEDWDDLEDAPEEEVTIIEEEFLDEATASRSIAELAAEIKWLEELEILAQKIKSGSVDRKWENVSKTLQDNVLMYRDNGKREKIIIFTEHRDTLNYLTLKITTMLGNVDSVVTIQGGMTHKQRELIETRFKNDPNVFVLVATDAAGEGINLQRSHLMINYDLPWNPNRIEQRFGRIHRINQREVCHLWNLVAMDTREGEVFYRLFEKLERERKALGGRVFDVLGKITFEEKPLRDLLIEAIRYGNDPERKKRLDEVIDGALDREGLDKLLDERSLAGQALGLKQVLEIKENMDRVEARRLQPFFIESFFINAFEKMKGQTRKRKDHRYYIPYVPNILREKRSVSGELYPISNKYEAITFEKQFIYVDGKPEAELICPGHPLLSVLIDEILSKNQDLLKKGTVFIDDQSTNNDDRLLFYIEDILEDGRKDSVGKPVKASHRIHFLEMTNDGNVYNAGFAPYLDYSSPNEEESIYIKKMISSKAWWDKDVEKLARDYAVQNIMPDHLKEIREMRIAYVNKVEQEVKLRLNSEIAYWDQQAGKMLDQGSQGKAKAERYIQRVHELEYRLNHRLEELKQEKNIIPKPPMVLGAAWVIPRTYLDEVMGKLDETKDLANRSIVERIAMNMVIDIEKDFGNIPKDVSDQKCGYDIESKTVDGKLRFIEVKGREAGKGTVIVTHNEIVVAFNKPEQNILAVVEVKDSYRKIVYYKNWALQLPSFADVSHTLELEKLAQIADVVFEKEIRNIGLLD